MWRDVYETDNVAFIAKPRETKNHKMRQVQGQGQTNKQTKKSILAQCVRHNKQQWNEVNDALIQRNCEYKQINKTIKFTSSIQQDSQTKIPPSPQHNRNKKLIEISFYLTLCFTKF